MKHLKPLTFALCLAGSATLPGGPALAHEYGTDARGPAVRAETEREPTLDPVLRAVLLGLAASLLREAAASPDPAGAFGEALERKLLLVLRSPEFARMAESFVGHATKDVPPELREPLQQFALAMLKSLRRDMLEGRRSRREIY
jgi:hypothetical protein